MQILLHFFDFVVGIASLEQKPHSFVLAVGLALTDEVAEVGEVLIFVDFIERIADDGFGQLECEESCPYFLSSPTLVFHLVVHVRSAETFVVEEVAGV